MGHLLDIVHQAEQLPLGVHLFLAPQGEPIHPLVPQIAEHRLDDRDPLIVDKTPVQCVELLFHPLDGTILFFIRTPDKDRDLFGLGCLGGRQTPLS